MLSKDTSPCTDTKLSGKVGLGKGVGGRGGSEGGGSLSHTVGQNVRPEILHKEKVGIIQKE